MKRSLLFLALFGLATASLHADEAVLSAQRSLKELGFYQGAEDGTVNVLFKGAVRRFQIHRGLTPTGELNAETAEAMREAVAEQPPPPPAPTEPASTPGVDNAVEQSDREFLNRQAPPPGTPPPPGSRPTEPRPLPPAPPAPPVAPQSPPASPPRSPGYAELFRGTPYFNAPPQVQRDTVAKAQRALAGRRYYRGPIDGLPGVLTTEAIMAYQRANRLRQSGRLDLDTLAVMRLLPAVGRPLPPRGAVRGVPLD